MAETQLAIVTQGLSRFFGTQCAVNQVNIQVDAGTFYGFLGPNGAGKSTTIKMLTGLLAPSNGEIRIMGLDPRDRKSSVEIKRRIGVVPENLALFENLTATEYLTFVGRMFLLDRDTIRRRTADLLGVLGLDREEKKLALEYSHGMQKKLAFAAAMLPNPDLLFLDEPFEGIDAVTSKTVRDMLAEFVKRGSTVFLTSHVLEIVERLCTHVGIISGGVLVEQGPLEELSGGKSLEQCFLEKVGSTGEASQKLSWLEEGTRR